MGAVHSPSSGTPEESLPIPALMLLALAFAGAALAGSPIAAGAAMAVFAAAWKRGSGAGAGCAVVAGGLIAALDPTLARPLGASAGLGIFLVMAAAPLLPGLLRTGLGRTDARPTYEESPPPRLEDVLAPMAPVAHPVVPPQERRGFPRRSSSPDAAAEGRTEVDVIERHLRDLRDYLSVDEAVFWRFRPGDEHLEPVATSAPSREESRCFGEPGYLDLVKWSATERLVTSSDDSSPELFITAAVGKGDSFHGALGLFAADRSTLSRDRLKTCVGRSALHLALLLELLDEARSARRYRRRSQDMMQAVRRIQNPLELAELGPAICESAMQTASASRAAFVLWSAGSREGSVNSVSPGHPLPTGFRVDAESLVGRACAEQQRFAIREAFRMSRDERIYGREEERRRIGSLGIVPISRAGETLGAIVVEGDAAAQVTAVEVDLLMHIAMPASISLVNTEQFSAVSERAQRDELTGLRNRRAFDERLRQLLLESDRFGTPVALILLDMDHFKRINDTEGHEAGDAALRAVARILLTTVRTVDMCARYGGEELAVLLPHTGLVAATEVAERIRKRIEATPIHHGDRAVRVTSSFGVSSYPESTTRSELLFRLADRALYEAKSAGRNCVRRAIVSKSATSR